MYQSILSEIKKNIIDIPQYSDKCIRIYGIIKTKKLFTTLNKTDYDVILAYVKCCDIKNDQYYYNIILYYHNNIYIKIKCYTNKCIMEFY